MMEACVISLGGSTRRSPCGDALRSLGIGFSFFEAVCGAHMSPAERSRHYDASGNQLRFKRPLSSAEIGCYVSHLRVWEYIASRDAEAALVLEDDFLPAACAKTFLQALSTHDLSDVFVKIDGFDDKRPLLREDTVVRVGGVRVGIPRSISGLTTGYVIGRNAARRMRLARDRFFRPVDIDLKFLWEHRVPVYATNDVIIRENVGDGYASAIAGGRREMQSRNRLLRATKHYRFQCDYMLRHWLWKGNDGLIHPLKALDRGLEY